MSPRTLHIIVLTTSVIALSIAIFTVTVERHTLTRFLQGTFTAVDEEIDVPVLPSIEEALVFGPREQLADPSYFTLTKEKFIDEGVDFIEADLTAMKIRLWNGGTTTLEFTVQTKGRVGSWWQTPAGVYKVEVKKEKHFSSFGHVYTNWNLPFQGNFFIHGWPYKEDGTPVPPGYSGGCIRLSEEDAKVLYEQAEAGMPIIVHESKFEPDTFSYTPPAIPVSAHAYAVVDILNNRVLADTFATSTAPIASLTKLMTALVATEYINLDKEITISSTALLPTSRPRLVAGERVLAFHLLYPLLTESSNEAAQTFANILGPQRFVDLMNTKAQSLGMRDTLFVDTTGVLQGNVSTTQDLAKLAQYLYNNRPFILNVTRGSLHTGAYEAVPYTNLVNYNLFSDDPDFIGGKVGKTDSAGETIVALFKMNIYGTERVLVFILLGSDDILHDIELLRNTIKSRYTE